MGLFSNNKKPCPLCGSPTPRLLATKVEDMPLCKECAGKIDLPDGALDRMTLAQLEQYMAFYEENAALRETFSEDYRYGFGLLQLEFLGFHTGGILLEALFGQFDLQFLVLDLLGNGIELAVVAHVVLLLLVIADENLGLVDLALALLGERVQLLDFGIDVVDPGFQAGHLVFEILNLERQFTFHLVDFVDPAVDLLQFIECDDLLLHRIVNVGSFLLCCHIMYVYSLDLNQIVHRIARAFTLANRKGNQIFRQNIK